jgi:Ca2+-binding EF-hand superfamily protein
MKTKLSILTVTAAIGCAITMLRAEDAPKPPATSEGRPGAPAGGGDPKARLEEMFKKMDTNGDGKISKEEYLAFEKQQAEERFSKIDTNNDGSIDVKEFEEAARKLSEARRGQQGAQSGGFRRPEGSGDGNRPRPSAADGGGAAPGGGRGGFGGGGMAEIYRKVNESGSITKEEFQKITTEQFDKLDANHDGKITKDELDAAIAKMREAFGNRGQGGAEGGPRRRPEADAKPADAGKPKDGS